MEVMDMNFDYDLSRICRSCRMDNLVLHPIFDSVGSSGVTLQEMMTACTQLKIHYNDGMPRNLCSLCVADINTAYNFRKRCEQSDMMLREYISRKKQDGSGTYRGNAVKMELFDIKPEITFIDADPLIGEKCFAVSIRDGNGVDGVNDVVGGDPEEGLIEALEDDESGEIYGPDDMIQAEFVDNSDKESNNEFDCGNLDDLIEEVDTEDDEEKPRTRHTRGRKVHGYTRIKGGTFSCDLCERIFSDKRGITNHLKQHEPKVMKECPTCGRSFSSSYHLSRHMKIHDEEVQCEHCERKFTAAFYDEYMQHMEQEHPGLELLPQRKFEKPERNIALVSTADMVDEAGKMEAICRICDTSFDRIAKLRNHLRSHVNPETFSDVNIHTKPYLFDEGYVLENYSDYLVQQVCKWDVLRFYQIVEPDGEELELSDSDSELEETEPLVEGIVRRDHVCALCNRSFSRIKAILNHARNEHRAEELINCRHCSRGFPSTELLVRHLKQQCENQHKKFFCTFCNEKFMWQTSLNKHAQCKHKPTKPLWDRADLGGNGEVDDKEKKFVCQVCNKGFQRLEHLERHIKIHIPSEKKFECTQCHKKFNRKDNLRSHMKIHKKDPEEDLANKQTHLCVYCGRGFSNSSNLIVHMRRHTGERPYKCDICDKGFPRSSDLQCHRRTHTGEKPCLCTICGKGFSRSNKLVRHMRIHTGARPYSCTYCDRAFTQSNDLTLHIRRHTGEKPYVCGVCNERFIQGTALKAHQRVTGHYDDGSSQPERFASISVNNPNRLGINGPKAVRQSSAGCTGDDLPKVVKPVKSRKKTNQPSGKPSSAVVQPATSRETPGTVAGTPTITIVPASTVALAPPSPGESSTGSIKVPQSSLHGLSGVPHGYVPMPYIMPSYDLASSGLFSQNFSQQQ